MQQQNNFKQNINLNKKFKRYVPKDSAKYGNYTQDDILRIRCKFTSKEMIETINQGKIISSKDLGICSDNEEEFYPTIIEKNLDKEQGYMAKLAHLLNMMMCAYSKELNLRWTTRVRKMEVILQQYNNTTPDIVNKKEDKFFYTEFKMKLSTPPNKDKFEEMKTIDVNNKYGTQGQIIFFYLDNLPRQRFPSAWFKLLNHYKDKIIKEQIGYLNPKKVSQGLAQSLKFIIERGILKSSEEELKHYVSVITDKVKEEEIEAQKSGLTRIEKITEDYKNLTIDRADYVSNLWMLQADMATEAYKQIDSREPNIFCFNRDANRMKFNLEYGHRPKPLLYVPFIDIVLDYKQEIDNLGCKIVSPDENSPEYIFKTLISQCSKFEKAKKDIQKYNREYVEILNKHKLNITEQMGDKNANERFNLFKQTNEAIRAGLIEKLKTNTGIKHISKWGAAKFPRLKFEKNLNYTKNMKDHISEEIDDDMINKIYLHLSDIKFVKKNNAKEAYEGSPWDEHFKRLYDISDETRDHLYNNKTFNMLYYQDMAFSQYLLTTSSVDKKLRSNDFFIESINNTSSWVIGTTCPTESASGLISFVTIHNNKFDDEKFGMPQAIWLQMDNGMFLRISKFITLPKDILICSRQMLSSFAGFYCNLLSESKDKEYIISPNSDKLQESFFWAYNRQLNLFLEQVYLLYKNTLCFVNLGKQKMLDEFSNLIIKDFRIRIAVNRLKAGYKDFTEKMIENVKLFKTVIEPLFKTRLNSLQDFLHIVYFWKIYPKKDGANDNEIFANFLYKDIQQRQSWENSTFHNKDLSKIWGLEFFSDNIMKDNTHWVADAFCPSMIISGIDLLLEDIGEGSFHRMPLGNEPMSSKDKTTKVLVLDSMLPKERRSREKNLAQKEHIRENKNLSDKDKTYKINALTENYNRKANYQSIELSEANQLMKKEFRKWLSEHIDEPDHFTKTEKIYFNKIINYERKICAQDLIFYLLIKDSVSDMILSCQVKEQSGYSKRIFYIQDYLSWLCNSTMDSSVFLLLELGGIDFINQSGQEKNITIECDASALNIQGLIFTEDETRYGDKYPVEALTLIIVRLYMRGYYSYDEAVFCIYCFKRIKNRYILIPPNLVKKWATSLSKGILNLKDQIINLNDKANMHEINFDFNKNMGFHKPIGWTLGVLNGVSSLGSELKGRWMRKLMESCIEGYKIFPRTHSDDGIKQTNLLVSKDDLPSSLTVNEGYFSLALFKTHNVKLKKDKSLMIPIDEKDNKKLRISNLQILLFSISAILWAGRFQGQEISVKKFVVGYSGEILQSYILHGKMHDSNMKTSITLGTNLQLAGPAVDINDMISRINPLITSGAPYDLLLSLQLVANDLVYDYYGVRSTGVNFPIEAHGLWVCHPMHWFKHGSMANEIRLLMKYFVASKEQTEFRKAYDIHEIKLDEILEGKHMYIKLLDTNEILEMGRYSVDENVPFQEIYLQADNDNLFTGSTKCKFIIKEVVATRAIRSFDSFFKEIAPEILAQMNKFDSFIKLRLDNHSIKEYIEMKNQLDTILNEHNSVKMDKLEKLNLNAKFLNSPGLQTRFRTAKDYINFVSNKRNKNDKKKKDLLFLKKDTIKKLSTILQLFYRKPNKLEFCNLLSFLDRYSKESFQQKYCRIRYERKLVAAKGYSKRIVRNHFTSRFFPVFGKKTYNLSETLDLVSKIEYSQIPENNIIQFNLINNVLQSMYKQVLESQVLVKPLLETNVDYDSSLTWMNRKAPEIFWYKYTANEIITLIYESTVIPLDFDNLPSIRANWRYQIDTRLRQHISSLKSYLKTINVDCSNILNLTKIITSVLQGFVWRKIVKRHEEGDDNHFRIVHSRWKIDDTVYIWGSNIDEELIEVRDRSKENILAQTICLVNSFNVEGIRYQYCHEDITVETVKKSGFLEMNPSEEIKTDYYIFQQMFKKSCNLETDIEMFRKDNSLFGINFLGKTTVFNEINGYYKIYTEFNLWSQIYLSYLISNRCCWWRDEKTSIKSNYLRVNTLARATTSWVDENGTPQYMVSGAIANGLAIFPFDDKTFKKTEWFHLQWESGELVWLKKESIQDNKKNQKNNHNSRNKFKEEDTLDAGIYRDGVFSWADIDDDLRLEGNDITMESSYGDEKFTKKVRFIQPQFTNFGNKITVYYPNLGKVSPNFQNLTTHKILDCHTYSFILEFLYTHINEYNYRIKQFIHKNEFGVLDCMALDKFFKFVEKKIDSIDQLNGIYITFKKEFPNYIAYNSEMQLFHILCAFNQVDVETVERAYQKGKLIERKRNFKTVSTDFFNNYFNIKRRQKVNYFNWPTPLQFSDLRMKSNSSITANYLFHQSFLDFDTRNKLSILAKDTFGPYYIGGKEDSCYKYTKEFLLIIGEETPDIKVKIKRVERNVSIPKPKIQEIKSKFKISEEENELVESFKTIIPKNKNLDKYEKIFEQQIEPIVDTHIKKVKGIIPGLIDEYDLFVSNSFESDEDSDEEHNKNKNIITNSGEEYYTLNNVIYKINAEYNENLSEGDSIDFSDLDDESDFTDFEI